MMYNQKAVVAIKANGKILREFKDIVYVPYGTEYSIFIKNLNSVRAIFNLEIDGTEVCPGGIIVNANSEVEIERFVKDLSKGNRFRFIERTKSIEDGPRGIKADDGLIRVSFQYEKVVQTVTTVTHHIHHNEVHHYPYRWPHYPYNPPVIYGGVLGGQTIGAAYTSNASEKMTATANTISAQGMTFGAMGASTSSPLRGLNAEVKGFADAGITVPGSVSDQKFSYVASFPTEAEEHVMVIRLLGEDPKGEIVKVPVTVKHKPRCVTCGKINRAVNKCCSECGTSLEVI